MNIEPISDSVIAALVLRIFDWIFGKLAHREMIDDVRHAIEARIKRRGVWSGVRSMIHAIFASLNPGPSLFSDELFIVSISNAAYFFGIAVWFKYSRSWQEGIASLVLFLAVTHYANLFPTQIVAKSRDRRFGTWIFAIPAYVGLNVALVMYCPVHAIANELITVLPINLSTLVAVFGKVWWYKRSLRKRGLMIDPSFRY